MEEMEEDAVSTLQHENSSLLELYMTFNGPRIREKSTLPVKNVNN